jgi:hypothetical protein
MFETVRILCEDDIKRVLKLRELVHAYDPSIWEVVKQNSESVEHNGKLGNGRQVLNYRSIKICV